MEKLCLPLGALNQGDVDWLTQAGRLETVTAGSVLVQAGQPTHELYFVLDGLLATLIASADGVEQEVSQFKPGEGVGFLALLADRPATTTLTAIAPSHLLIMPYAKLRPKLRQDSDFAARFYQTLSVLLSNQLRGLSTLMVRSQATAEQPLRKVLLVFAELYDSDLDWFVKVGTPQRLATKTLLIQEGKSLDAIYILLEGTLAVSVTAMVEGRPVSKEVAKLSTGEILGEMSFIDAQLPSATVSVMERSLVLALPRSQLATKLQTDRRFAARFYRAIVVVLVERLQDRLTRHGYGKLTYDKDQPLDDDLEYEDELDANTLEHVSLSGARFDWLLRRVRGEG